MFGKIAESTRLIKLEGVGDIVIRKSTKNKRLSISISPSKGIRVSIPYRVSFNEGEQFVMSRAEWIRKHYIKFQKFEANKTIFNEQCQFKTRLRQLRVVKDNFVTLKAKLTPHEIIIECPLAINIELPLAQKLIKELVIKALRAEAKEYLPIRTLELAKIYGFKCNNISVKNTKTRWGSCSATNNINLNIHLIRLPDFLIDYVILHELVHTIHKNHSARFWNKFDEIVGDAKELAKKMKAYKIEFF